MRALGIDPSSYAVGIAAVDDGGQLMYHEQWRTGLPDTSDPVAIADAQFRLLKHLVSVINGLKPDVMLCEQLAVAQSLKTVRAILYFEATAMLASRWMNLPLKKPVATAMRRDVFGNGGLSKERTAMVVRKALDRHEMYLPTPRSKQEVFVFTDDETDAYAYGCLGVGHSLKPVAVEMGFVKE